jgi:putative PIN family toxin of toxin-antitoxin system
MIRAVVDTNVLVSGFLSASGPPGRIVDWLRAGTVIAVLDDRIFAEYADVLARPAFRLSPADVEDVLAAIRSHAVWADVGPQDQVTLPDPDDAAFAECALVEAVPLVTGNQRHFPKPACRGLRIMAPAEFVRFAGRTK